jgi:hypothetical protein
MASISGILNEGLNGVGGNPNLGDPLNEFFGDNGYQFQDDPNNNFGADMYFDQLPPMPPTREEPAPVALP